MRNSLLILALSLTCCGAPDEPAAEEPASALEMSSEDVPLPACGAVFSPEPRLRELTETSAARWRAAAGCDVYVGIGGIPVVLAESVQRPDGTQSEAVTERRRDPAGGWIIEQIKIHVGSDDKARSVLHEMGHALGADGHTLEEGVLSNSKDYTPVIDAPSLELLCSFVDCPEFAPER